MKASLRTTLKHMAAYLGMTLMVLALTGILSQNIAARSAAAPAASTYFRLSTGGVDASSRQLIRTADDRLYVFGLKQEWTRDLVGYWTTTAGLPNGSTDF